MRGIVPNCTYFYGPHKNSPEMKYLPMDNFAADLDELATHVHDELAVRWDQDAAALFVGATGLQLFTGAAPWDVIPETLVRVHAVGEDGFIYRTACFAVDPAPHWFFDANGPRWQGGAVPISAPFSMIRWKERSWR